MLLRIKSSDNFITAQAITIKHKCNNRYWLKTMVILYIRFDLENFSNIGVNDPSCFIFMLQLMCWFGKRNGDLFAFYAQYWSYMAHDHKQYLPLNGWGLVDLSILLNLQQTSFFCFSILQYGLYMCNTKTLHSFNQFDIRAFSFPFENDLM